jgi:sugar phosphate isomerase/epimerase
MIVVQGGSAVKTNEIGVLCSLKENGRSLQPVADFGLPVCQVVCWKADLFTDAAADALRRESEERKVRITSLWAGWPGPKVWNLVDGPETLGLVPRAFREMRMAALRKAGEFAQRAGLAAVVTHLGFIPENPKEPLFQEVVDAVRAIAEFLAERNVQFWFETGQETPVTMLRLIEAVNTGNLGVNLDTGNLILYGRGHPVDALDVFGQYVRSIHAKDAFFPTRPMELGREVKVGAGRVRFPELVRRLREIHFDGAFIIEREISGEQQRKDIAETVQYLGALLEETP